jgi:DNA-binding CsgD family transcriptional regulator
MQARCSRPSSTSPHEMTSRDIATKLFISERTVEAHVTNMLNKLGLNSRIEVARWLASVRGTEPITPDAR